MHGAETPESVGRRQVAWLVRLTEEAGTPAQAARKEREEERIREQAYERIASEKFAVIRERTYDAMKECAEKGLSALSIKVHVSLPKEIQGAECAGKVMEVLVGKMRETWGEQLRVEVDPRSLVKLQGQKFRALVSFEWPRSSDRVVA